jgi:uncharacterized membrane protein
MVLRGGLLLGSALMAIGMVMALFEGRLRAHPVALSQIGHLVVSRHPSGITALGLVILLGTPAARVIALVVSFVCEHDYRFAVVALSVAVLLSIGLALGRV